jgi:hypothetical protein
MVSYPERDERVWTATGLTVRGEAYAAFEANVQALAVWLNERTNENADVTEAAERRLDTAIQALAEERAAEARQRAEREGK